LIVVRSGTEQSYPPQGYPAGPVSWILVTNDDGVDSPALLPLVRALQPVAAIEVVVPDRERSWIGKAITRWEEVAVERRELDGIPITAVDGFPADCTNLGVHSLFDEMPEMVVSGVNLGLNTGLGFFLSSGTVGAAAEGWIAGVPALAFSIGIQGNDRDWKSKARGAEAGDVWERAAAVAVDVVRTVRQSGFPTGVDLLSVNMPFDVGPATPRRITGLARVGYTGLFRSDDGSRYRHDFRGELLEHAPLSGTDVAAVREGAVSITPVQLARAVEVDAELRAALERNT